MNDAVRVTRTLAAASVAVTGGGGGESSPFFQPFLLSNSDLFFLFDDQKLKTQ